MMPRVISWFPTGPGLLFPLMDMGEGYDDENNQLLE